MCEKVYEKKLTVFTPTYNRGYILGKCYDSLCKQTSKDFVWLIVNDGSTDNTELLVGEWIKEKRIDIQYIKQCNAGKHVAHNTGVLACKTEMFICVDSDDYLTENAVYEILEAWEQVSSDESLAGFIALRGYSEKRLMSTELPHSTKKCSISELYIKYGFKGETTLVFKTRILKEYLYPVFEGERFVTEAVVYDQISQKYKMLLLNKVFYLAAYLDDGYTNNIRNIHKQNKKGYLFYLIQRIRFSKTFREKYLAYSYYLAGCISIGKTANYRTIESLYMCPLCLPKALVIYIKPFLKDLFFKAGLLGYEN